MSITSNIASHRRNAGARKVPRFRIMIGIIALFGIALCAVIGSAYVAVDPSQAQLIGP